MWCGPEWLVALVLKAAARGHHWIVLSLRILLLTPCVRSVELEVIGHHRPV